MDLPDHALRRVQRRIHYVNVSLRQLVAHALWAAVLKAEWLERRPLPMRTARRISSSAQTALRILPAALRVLLALQIAEDIPGAGQLVTGDGERLIDDGTEFVAPFDQAVLLGLACLTFRGGPVDAVLADLVTREGSDLDRATDT